MTHPNKCPECGEFNTEVQNTMWFSDIAKRTRICKECPTMYTVVYGNPNIEEVSTYE